MDGVEKYEKEWWFSECCGQCERVEFFFVAILWENKTSGRRKKKIRSCFFHCSKNRKLLSSNASATMRREVCFQKSSYSKERFFCDGAKTRIFCNREALWKEELDHVKR